LFEGVRYERYVVVRERLVKPNKAVIVTAAVLDERSACEFFSQCILQIED
jgi:hypothetical protein